MPIILLFTVSCDLTEHQVFDISKGDYPEEQSDSMSVVIYKTDSIERTMQAESMERYYDEKKTVSYKVIINDYNQDGNVELTLTADTLYIDEIKNVYTGKGDVVIEREEGLLQTEHLIWYQNNNRVYSPVEATIIRGRNILKGYELTTNTDFTQIELKQVTAEGIIDEEDIDW